MREPVAAQTRTIVTVWRYGGFAEIWIIEPDQNASRRRVAFMQNWPHGLWPPRKGDVIDAGPPVRLIGRDGVYDAREAGGE